MIDISTTEVADYVVGGIMACSPNRFQATLNQGIPFVLSVGALDMVNFGNKSSVPSQFANRKLHLHNDQVSISKVYHNPPLSCTMVTDKMWVIRYSFSPFVCEECLV